MDVGLTWSSLDPAVPGLGPLLFAPFSFLYDGLFKTTPNGKVVPDLATSYKYDSTRTVLTINLRHGVKFQDGTPFNAAAAVYNLQRVASAAGNSECVPYFAAVTSMTAQGNYQVVLKFSKPYGPMIDELAGQDCARMASPTAIKKYGKDYGAHPVGTGPFKFDSEVVNSDIKFSRWSGYWQKGKPYLDTATITASDNDQTALDAVETGTAQLMVGNAITPTDITNAKQHGLTVQNGDPTGFENIRLNLQKPPFNNRTARLAIVRALNKQSIAKQLYQGTVTATDSYENPACFCFTGAKLAGYPSYDPKAAAADAKKVGGLSFTMNVENVPDQVQLAEAIAGQLKAAGIQVKLNPVEEVTLLANFHAKTFTAGLTNSVAFPDPDTLYYRNFYSKSNNNQTGLDDPQLDKLLIQAQQAVKNSVRKQLYSQAQQRLTGAQGDFPQIPLYTPIPKSIKASSLQDAPIYASTEVNAVGMWVSGS